MKLLMRVWPETTASDQLSFWLGLFRFGSEAETGLAQLLGKWGSALRQTAELASGHLSITWTSVLDPKQQFFYRAITA